MNSNYQNQTGKVHVSAYERDDGTDVREYWRNYPGNGQRERITPVEYTTDLCLTASTLMFHLAGINYLNARYNLFFAKHDPNADVFNSRSEITHKNITNFLNSAHVPNNTRAVIYYSKSKYTQQLSKAKEIKNYINTHYLSLRTGALKDTSISIEFRDSIDNYLGIQHATLFDSHIDAEGYFNAFLVDYYDFNMRQYGESAVLRDIKNIDFQSLSNVENLKNFGVEIKDDILKDLINYTGTYANNNGYSLQEKKQLENYVIIYYIHTKEY